MENVSDFRYTRELIISSRLSEGVGVAPRRRCVVEHKYSFSILGSICIGFGWRMAMKYFSKIFWIFRRQSLLIKGSFQLLYGSFYAILDTTESLPYNVRLSFMGYVSQFVSGRNHEKLCL